MFPISFFTKSKQGTLCWPPVGLWVMERAERHLWTNSATAWMPRIHRCSLKSDINTLFLSMFKKQWGDRVVTHTHTIPHSISSLELGFSLINRTKNEWAFFLRHGLPGERHQRFCLNIKNSYKSPHVGFTLVWNLPTCWCAASILWLPTWSVDQAILPTAYCTFWPQCPGQYTHVLGLPKQDTIKQEA